MLWKAKDDKKNKKKGCQCIAVRRQKQRNDNKNKKGIVVQYERALSVVMVNQETEQVCSR